MNLYEALGAPPTLSSKEMAMHIRMMPSSLLSAQERTQYSRELINPKTRLYNELKTLRFPPRPGAAEEDPLYKHVCKKIAHAKGEPIPYRFFKTEFQNLLKDCGYTKNTSASSVTESVLNNAIGQISDIWRYQGYAALCLRIAEDSELNDPKNAPKAWLIAIQAYQRFFTKADVKDSCAYRAQTEEKFRKDCSEAWDQFLAAQLEGVFQRMERYIQQNKVDGVGACLQILQLDPVKNIDPELFTRAVKDCLLPYASAIKAAPTLSKAGQMYNNCPKKLLEMDDHGECKRAMLCALSKAVDQLDTNGSDIAEIINWTKALKAKDLFRKGPLLVKSDAEAFFNACAVFIRSVIQDDKFDRTKEMELLVTILPDDFVIAKSGKEDLKQDDMLGYGVLMYLNDIFNKDVTEKLSESAAKQIGSRVYKIIDENIPAGDFRNETLGKVNRFVIIQLQNKKVTPSAFRAFVSVFPDNWPIDIPQVSSFGELKGGAAGDPLVAKAFKLLKEASEATAGTLDQEKKVRALIDFACENPGLDLGQDNMKFKELVDHILIQAFVGSFNVYINTDLSFNRDDPDVMAKLEKAISIQSHASGVIKLCGSFLPKNTKLPADGRMKPTTDSLMDKISVKKDSAFVKRRKQYNRSRIKKKPKEKTSKPTTKVKSPKPSKPVKAQKPVKTKSKYTKLNGIRFRGGSAAAAIQYFLWMLVLPAIVFYGITRMPTHSIASMMTRLLLLRATIYVCGALLLNGVFGLMANSYRERVSGFGKTMRVFVWMTTVLMIIVYASRYLLSQSVFLRVILGIWVFVLLIVMHKQITKNAYYPKNTITIDAITYHGGGIAVFFKFIIVQLVIPCIVASLIYIFRWRLSPGWIFVFKLYGVAMALSILRAFFTCLAEESNVRRFATFMSTEVYMLVLPICGWYSINYFNAYPLKWWIIVLYSVYGLFFLIVTIAAAQSKD